MRGARDGESVLLLTFLSKSKLIGTRDMPIWQDFP